MTSTVTVKQPSSSTASRMSSKIPLWFIFFFIIHVITISPRVQCTGERSNFAVDTRSFLEALKGESLEEALGGDSGYEGESYGGISGASRDPEVSAVTSVPPSSYDSVDDAPDDTDDESRDSRSSYASGSGRNNNNNREAIQSFRYSYGSRSKTSAQQQQQPETKSESSSYFPALPVPNSGETKSSYSSASSSPTGTSDTTLRNFRTASSPRSVEENRVSYRTSSTKGTSGSSSTYGGRRQQSSGTKTSGAGSYSSSSGGSAYSSSTSSYAGTSGTGSRKTASFNPRLTPTTQTTSGGSDGGYSFSVTHPSGGVKTGSRPTTQAPVDDGQYERPGVDRGGTADYGSTDDFDYRGGSTGGSDYPTSSRRGGPFSGTTASSAPDYDYDESTHLAGLAVYGRPGEDFPIFASVPRTGFTCDGKAPGYYADPAAGCQAFYICQRGGRMDGFLCPNATLFSQQLLVCDYWWNVDCSQAESFYSINEGIFTGGGGGGGYGSRGGGESYGGKTNYGGSSGGSAAGGYIPQSPGFAVKNRPSSGDSYGFDKRTDRTPSTPSTPSYSTPLDGGSSYGGTKGGTKGGSSGRGIRRKTAIVRTSTPVYSAYSRRGSDSVTYTVEPNTDEDDYGDEAKSKKR